MPDEFPKVIDRVDLLSAENLNLKMQNIQLQLKAMQEDLQKALKTRGELVTEMNTLRDLFQTKYGVAVERLQIHADGTYSETAAPAQATVA